MKIDENLHLTGLLKNGAYEPVMFSDIQKLDLALSVFLVRAYALDGSFYIDEPLAHLDDVNRVALLDALRAFVLHGLKKIEKRD